ncbi:unnamed protein product [Clonostachys rhizophaga]|uniref:Heterokaryon incompatibility domain-containing protein n=1 Tax=Clonostachys rhizophaga TaxID=160324 RepID=A0A9N9YQ45_9HYPO|nr:unnamed protein product [Clonostachys rhizophaga]
MALMGDSSSTIHASPFSFPRCQRMQTYKHQRLDDARSQIRLLKLHPGTGKLSGELFAVWLDGSAYPQYEPISYCWGSQKDQQVILLDGLTFAIGRNLYTALKRLRYADSARVLWCDVLCIDQSNTAEKSVQIPLMRQIYQKGSRTLVWLGEHDRRTARIFRMFETLERRYMEDAEAQMPSYQWRRINHDRLDIPRWARPLVPIVGFVTDIQGEKDIANLQKMDWMHRVWVIQEAAVSEQITVICGKYSTNWETVVRAHTVSDAGWDQNFSNIIFHAQAFRDADYQSFASLVSDAMGARATDERDYIYGILGLLDPDSVLSKEIEPDYSVNPLEVFHKVTKITLENTEDANIILLGSKNLSTKLPSWSWHPYSEDDHRYVGWELREKEDLRATMASSSKIAFLENDRVLQLAGYSFGTVTTAGPAIPPEDDPFGVKMLRFIYRSVLTYFHSRSITGADIERPYMNTSMTTTEAFYWSMLMPETDGDDEADLNHNLKMVKDLDELLRRKFSFLAKKPELWSGLSALYVWPRVLEITLRSAFGSSQTECLEIIRRHTHVYGYRAISTSEGYMGFSTGSIHLQDKIFLLQGVRTPVVLRRASANANWRIIGEIYIPGAMLGELWDESKCHDVLIE